MGRLQAKLKERDKRIEQLESTIIDNIESRAKEDSNTSIDSDIEKHKNTVRNLKVVVTSLQEENNTMKTKLKLVNSENNELKNRLSQVSIEPDNLDIAERASHDEPSMKVVEDVVGMLRDEAEHEGSCKCLEKVTEHLLQLNEEYPELEPMLE
jgi:chromosome segregation ATPase